MLARIARYSLLVLLILLGLGGLAGGGSMLFDPSGADMGLSVEMLDGLPVADFVLPGLFLVGVMGVAPLVIAFGMWKHKSWSWAAALILGIILVLWIGFQIVLWGAPQPVQVLYLAWGILMAALCFVPGLRTEIQRLPATKPQRPPDLIELEAQFTKEVDPERAKNRQISNTLRSGRG